MFFVHLFFTIPQYCFPKEAPFWLTSLGILKSICVSEPHRRFWKTHILGPYQFSNSSISRDWAWASVSKFPKGFSCLQLCTSCGLGQHWANIVRFRDRCHDFPFLWFSSIAFSVCYFLLFIFTLQKTLPIPAIEPIETLRGFICMSFLFFPLKCLSNTALPGMLCRFCLSKRKRKTALAFLLFSLSTWGLGGISYMVCSLVANFTLLIPAK